MPIALPRGVDDTLALLGQGGYVADRSLATAVTLALKLDRPLFLEGEAGVGKTEIAKVLAQTLGRRLVRLQCYEGLDVAAAVYEWNYARQMIEIRMAEATSGSRASIEEEIFSDRFLIRRPLLQALSPDTVGPPVLLIDELDRADEPFEAFLLETLSDWQVTIPEFGTIKAPAPPITIITSNRTREIHDALKRRCYYYWVDYPDARARARDPEGEGARGAAQAHPRDRRLRAEAARRGPVQGARRRRDDRLGEGARRARQDRARSRHHQRHARRRPQVPGRHRADPRRDGHPDAGPGPRGARHGRRMTAPTGQLPAEDDRGTLVANVVHFARVLRGAGLPIGPGRAIEAVRALEAIGLATRGDFYWTLHAVFVNRRDQHEIFDQAFKMFWRDPQLLERMLSFLLPQARGGEKEDEREKLSRRLAEAFQAGTQLRSRSAARRDARGRAEVDAVMTWSNREVLQDKDFEQMSNAELAQAKLALQKLQMPFNEMRTRRFRTSHRGSRIDFRSTLRAWARSGGNSADFARREPRTRLPPLVCCATSRARWSATRACSCTSCTR
jgi:MoxR-like ATPase